MKPKSAASDAPGLVSIPKPNCQMHCSEHDDVEHRSGREGT